MYLETNMWYYFYCCSFLQSSR